MESLDFWRLSEELNVIQAALLLVGCDPSSDDGYAERWDMDKRPKGYEAAKAAISNALRRGAIKGHLVPQYRFDPDLYPHDGVEIENSIDFFESQVEVESFRQWLVSRGISTGFFFPNASDAPNYLDSKHLRYSARLAAAVRAWQAMEDENLRRGKSAKTAMEHWITTNYRTLGLIHKKGSVKHGYKAGDMNITAMEEAAKIANWELDGGPPKTPTKAKLPPRKT